MRGDLRLEAGIDHGCVVKGVGRQELQEIPDVIERRPLRVDHLMDVAVASLVIGTAEFVEGDILTGDVLDDVGTGDEHVALVADGDDEIGLDRRVHRAAGTLAQDDRDLRHHAGEQFMAAAQLGVPGERGGRVLDAGAAGVVDADDGATDHGHPLHQPGHLAAEHLPHGALEDGLVVAEHPDGAAVDGAVPGDHAVAEQRVRISRSLGQRTDLKKAARVDQFIDPVPCAGQTFLRPLGDGLLTTGFLGQFQLLAEFFQQFSGRFVGHFPCFASLWMRLIAALRCAPTLAMYGSSMAWMCSPPIGITSRSEANSPQPPSGWRIP